MTRRPGRRPVSASNLRSPAAVVRALAPLPLDDASDLRAAFDAVRAHPAVVAASAAAESPVDRDALAAARAALVRRSVVAATLARGR